MAIVKINGQGSYSSIQEALTNLGGNITEDTVIEVSASSGNAETVTGFSITGTTFTVGVKLTIQGASGHAITIDGNGSIGANVYCSVGSIELRNFILTDSNGTPANEIIKVVGLNSTDSLLGDLTLSQITINNEAGYVKLQNAISLSMSNVFIVSSSGAGDTVKIDTIDTVDISYSTLKNTNGSNNVSALKISNYFGNAGNTTTITKCDIQATNYTGIQAVNIDNLNISRSSIHDCGRVGVTQTVKQAVGSTTVIENCVFYNIVAELLNGGDVETVVLKHNTFRNNRQEQEGIYYNNCEYFTNYKNIYYREDTAPDNVAHLEVRFKTPTDCLSRIYSDFNIYYRATGEGSNAFINNNIPESGYNSSLAMWQSETGKDSGSISLDPKLVNNYELEEDSPARNNVDLTQTTEFDVRGYYRQDEYQDIGAWDYDAQAGSKPANDGEAPAGVYRLSDNKLYGSPREAMMDQNGQMQDETIIINTVNPQTGVWFSNRVSNGYVLTVKGADELGQRAIFGSNAGVAMSIENVENIVFENIHFQAAESDFAAVRIGLAQVKSVIFKNCKFSGSQHGAYIYVGDTLEFYNCIFTDVTDYAFSASSVRNLVLDSCTFNWGSAEPGMASGSRMPVFISYLSGRTLIDNCNFTDVRQDMAFKCADAEHFTLRNSLISDTIKMAFWFVHNGELSAKSITLENNVFKNIITGQTETYLFQVDQAGSVDVIGNSFITPIYQSGILIREGTERTTFYNNYFEIANPTAITGKYLLSIQLGEGGTIGDHFIQDNNYFLLDETLGDNIGITSVSFEGGVTTVMKELASLQSNGLETNGFVVRENPMTSLLDVNYLPIAASAIVGAGDPVKAKANYEFNRKVRDGHDIGAANLATTEPLAQHTYAFEIHNNADGAIYESNDGGVTNIDVPYTDDIHFEPIISGFPDMLRWRIKMQTQAHAIAEIDFESNVIRIVGDITDETEFIREITIGSSTDNDGTYKTSFIMYEIANDKTAIYLADDVPGSVADGEITFNNYIISRIGQSINIQFDQKDKVYDIEFSATKTGQTDVEINREGYFSTLEARPIAKFYQDKYLIYVGDSVSFFSEAFAAASHEWNIQTPEGDLIRTTENVLNIPFSTAGTYSVQLSIGNGIGYNSVLLKPQGVVVEEIPLRPKVDFNTDKEVMFANETLQCKLLSDATGQGRVTRFLQPNDVVKWVVRRSSDKEELLTVIDQEPSINWATSIGEWGEFDLIVRIHGAWGGVEQIKRRMVTVYPDLTGRTVHNIACTEEHNWDYEGVNRYGTHLHATDLLEAHNTATINPGDVIRLSGITRELWIDNLQGTAENPIIIIPDCGSGEPFKVSVRGWQGILMMHCEHVYFVGSNNNGGLEYGFEIFTNPDPLIFMAAPTNHGIKVSKFSKEVHISGFDIHDMKFAGMAAKTEPKPDDPSTWRNDPTGGFLLTGMRVHHNHIHDTEGEGLYFGYFNAHSLGTATNSLGQQVEYFAHVHTDLMIYRNKFIRNGYDAIQVGNHIGHNEIHDNLCLDSGHLDVFGQNSAMSMGYYCGDIYNNICNNVIQFGAFQQGTVRIFNNLLDSIYGRNVDVIYLHVEPNPKFNYSVSPPVITDAQDDLSECKYEIFNNVILAGRQAVQVNCKIVPGYYLPNKVDFINNIVVIKDYSWNNNKYAIDNADRDQWQVNIMSSHLGPVMQANSIMSNNTIVKFSEIDTIKFLAIDNANPMVAPTSPALSGGFDLSDRYPTIELFDGMGFSRPETDGVFGRGMYLYLPNNYDYVSVDNLGENILFRIWSTQSNRWVLGIVESIEDIDPAIAPDESGETVDATSLCILKDHSPKPFPTSAKAHGVKGDVRYSEDKIAICVNDNTWLFSNRTNV